MRFPVLLGLILAISTPTLARAHAEGGEAPPDGPPPAPPAGAAPPAPPAGAAPPAEAAAADAAPGAGGGMRKRPTKRFTAGEQIFIRGGRSCYLRPQCNAEKAKSRFRGKLSGRRLVCAHTATKAKPTAQQLEFLWKAAPCTSPQGQKGGYVKFENGKHKNRFLCLTRKNHKPPKRRYGVRFGILGHLKNRGCTWKVKEAKVYNRKTKQLETRHVFINRKHKRYMLRTRRRCKMAPPGPRRVFGAQNYLKEARIDPLGSFVIEPAGAAEAGYDTAAQ